MRHLFFIIIITVLGLSFISCKSKKSTHPPAWTSDGKNGTAPAAKQETSAPIGLNLGNTAPEISLKNPAGAVINLSSLRGKVVLVDFWASWCGPCRFENPTVVAAYKKYNFRKLKGGKDGFTVYSVSLDMDVNAWKKAIEKDSLSWSYHVSDLKGWSNEAAARYSVTGIPTNFLLNEDGIIIDKNLRGEALLKALDKLAAN